MIRLSRTAQAQGAALTRHYQGLERPETVQDLRAAVVPACDRIVYGRGPFFPAPRPYPALVRPGWLWLKEATYWIGFAADAHGHVVRVVFYETADIPGRMPGV